MMDITPKERQMENGSRIGITVSTFLVYLYKISESLPTPWMRLWPARKPLVEKSLHYYTQVYFGITK